MARRPRTRADRVALEEGRTAGLRNPYAFLRQMRQEAHGQDLTSPAGAKGPAQITDPTAAAWGLSPAQVHGLRSSYRAAATHMAAYERQFGSTTDALVAYNAGPGRVGTKLPRETTDYIRTILPNGDHVARGGSRPAARVPARSRTAAPASSSPVPASSSPAYDQAGYDQAVRRQRVASLLEHSGRGHSFLFRSGLLSSRPVDPTAFGSSSSAALTPDTSPLPSLPSPTAAHVSQLAPSGDTIAQAVRSAQKRLGIHEVGQNNRGPQVDKLESKFGMIGQPWCGIYLGTVLRHAGVKVDSRVASVSEIERMARNHTGGFEGGFHAAKHARAGDALITRQGEHVAFVESVDRDGTIHTIGGNQGNGEVSRGTWRPDQVYGIARPGYRHG